ncbi:MAG: ATP synthase F1 subunit epsilon [Pseudomonadota bacterium]
MATIDSQHAGGKGQAASSKGGGGGRLVLSIVTPVGRALAGDADELTAPGVLGEFGILPGHVPFLSAVKAGVITYRDGNKRCSLAVGPGYVQVGAGDRVLVLVRMAVMPENADSVEAQREIDEISAKMKKGLAQGPELSALEAQLAWARARLAVALPAESKRASA